MPKPRTRAGIFLDLLKPQSNPEKLPVHFIKWLLSSGRYIFIGVEALVLIAFLARFKLDADIQATKESIDSQVPYIQNLKPYEILIRQTQFKLSAIANLKETSVDYPSILKEISNQTPQGIKITSLTMTKQANNVDIKLSGQAQTNNDVSAFIAGLKSDNNFSNVNLASIGIEDNSLRFTTSLSVKSGSNTKKP